MMSRPDFAVLTSGLTSPPTPAMQDISATFSRSICIAIMLAVCAAEEHPEQE
ncbi:hypothetical protein C1A50_3771 [Paenibacillus polymyxa]|nr:hypothetical protein C1A50_3771 [Paenibacillus polymyxa]